MTTAAMVSKRAYFLNEYALKMPCPVFRIKNRQIRQGILALSNI